jgi:hypothetical protein
MVLPFAHKQCNTQVEAKNTATHVMSPEIKRARYAARMLNSMISHCSLSTDNAMEEK